MKPIKFDGMNGTAAEDQPEYLPLPMYRDDTHVISCWQATWRERIKILFTGRVWLDLLQFREPITPSLLLADSPLQQGGADDQGEVG